MSDIKLMTLNVRHDHGPNSSGQPFTAPDSMKQTSGFRGEQPWSIRKWKIADTVLLWSPDIVGFQEPVYHQSVDLEELLHEEYSWVGAGRNDGNEDGEYCPVFYKSTTVTMQDWKTVWLSETPDIPGSKSWDSSHPRIATQVLFKRKADDALFTVFNVHFDHRGIEARQHAAELLVRVARDISHPVFLIGDLNSPENDPGYLTLTGARYNSKTDANSTFACLQALNNDAATSFAQRLGNPGDSSGTGITLPTHRVIRRGQILESIRRQQQEQSAQPPPEAAPTQEQQQQQQQQQQPYFLDARYELRTRLTRRDRQWSAQSGPFGFADTFTSFGDGDNESKRAPLRLDYILMMHAQDTIVKRFGVFANQFDDGLIISDHRPVFATVHW